MDKDSGYVTEGIFLFRTFMLDVLTTQSIETSPPLEWYVTRLSQRAKRPDLSHDLMSIDRLSWNAIHSFLKQFEDSNESWALHYVDPIRAPSAWNINTRPHLITVIVVKSRFSVEGPPPLRLGLAAPSESVSTSSSGTSTTGQSLRSKRSTKEQFILVPKRHVETNPIGCRDCREPKEQQSLITEAGAASDEREQIITMIMEQLTTFHSEKDTSSEAKGSEGGGIT